MKRTSHTTRNHKRRQPIPGLTPADVVQAMAEEARGNSVRKVRRQAAKQVPAVLSPAREGDAAKAGSERVSPAAPGDDAKRPGQPVESEVSDTAGTQLTKVLRRLLGQTPPRELMDVEGVGQVATNAEALGAVILREALAGRQWAVEMMRDQTEGKPVRAAQVNNADNETEKMLDRVGQAQLNALAKGK